MTAMPEQDLRVPAGQARAATSLGQMARRYMRWSWVPLRLKPKTSWVPRRRLGLTGLLWRIVFINIAALIPFVIGVFWVTTARNNLIDERVKSLLVQGRIIASAIADNATPEEVSPLIDPDKARETMQALVRPTGTRARLFSLSGDPLLDTRFLLPRNQVTQSPLPLPGQAMTLEAALRSFNNTVYELIAGRDLPLYLEGPNLSGLAYDEVAKAIANGEEGFGLRVNANGELIVSVAVPIQRLVSVRAVLMLSTEAGDLADAQRQDALTLFYTAFAALVALMFLSWALSRDIAWPVQQLAEAADKVRRGDADETAIPQLRYSADELRALSASLRAMTGALTDRLDTIELFAADVSHELKNPLTSLRSAVETLGRTPDEERRKKLMSLIQSDVRRIDRLISDISDASRLDAELNREKAASVDLADLTRTILSLYQDQDPPLPVRFEIDAEDLTSTLRIHGREGALAQVFRNIIDNAISFSPKDGLVRMTLSARDGKAIVAIEDEGPGIPNESLKRVFERFYTHRPASHGFGKNSGLGLSISKQIVEAHGGEIAAANRVDAIGKVVGAKLTVSLAMS
jgi:two-component system sensor histidine kinase ChvG